MARKVTVKDETETPESGVGVVNGASRSARNGGSESTAASDEPAEPSIEPAGVVIPNVQSVPDHGSQAAEDTRDASVAEPNT